MRTTTLTVSFNTEKLDALKFHMEKRDADLQAELNDTVQKLYEKYVPRPPVSTLMIRWRERFHLPEIEPGGQNGLQDG